MKPTDDERRRMEESQAHDAPYFLRNVQEVLGHMTGMTVIRTRQKDTGILGGMFGMFEISIHLRSDTHMVTIDMCACHQPSIICIKREDYDKLSDDGKVSIGPP